MRQLTGEAPATAAEPAFASLDSQERARRIVADQARTAETLRAIEAGENRAPAMPGDVSSLHRRMDRTLVEYNWMKNKGPVLPDFNFKTVQEAAEDARAIVRALVVAVEAL